MKKEFQSDESGYTVTLTVTNGHRVIDILSSTIIKFDKEFNLVEYSRRSSDGLTNEPDENEVETALKYATNKSKKLATPNKKYKIVCQPDFRGRFFTKEVHKTTSGGFNTREAEARQDKIVEWSDDVQKELDLLEPYEEELSIARQVFEALERKQRTRREDTAKRIFNKN